MTLEKHIIIRFFSEDYFLPVIKILIKQNFTWEGSSVLVTKDDVSRFRRGWGLSQESLALNIVKGEGVWLHSVEGAEKFARDISDNPVKYSDEGFVEKYGSKPKKEIKPIKIEIGGKKVTL